MGSLRNERAILATSAVPNALLYAAILFYGHDRNDSRINTDRHKVGSGGA